MPTIHCSLPPTCVCFWPSSTSVCRKSRLWFPWKPHRSPPCNVCNIVGLVWQRWSRMSCYPIPSWATSSCFPPKPSSPLLVAVAKAALVSGNPVWREDFCCQRVCHATLSSSGRTEQQNCTCIQSEPSAQLCALRSDRFPTCTPSSHTPSCSITALQLEALENQPLHVGKSPPWLLQRCREPNAPKIIEAVEDAQAACEVHMHWARHVLEEPLCMLGRSPCAYFCLGNPGKSSRTLIQEKQKQTGIASI